MDEVDVVDIGFVKVGWTWPDLTEMINKFHYILVTAEDGSDYIDDDEWDVGDIGTIANIEIMLMSEPEEIYLKAISVAVIVRAWGIVNQYEADGREYDF